MSTANNKFEHKSFKWITRFFSVVPFVHQFNAFRCSLWQSYSWNREQNLGQYTLNRLIIRSIVRTWVLSFPLWIHTKSSTTTKSTRHCSPFGHSTQLHSTFMCFDIVLLPKYTDQHTHTRRRVHVARHTLYPVLNFEFWFVVLVNLWKLQYNWILSFRRMCSLFAFKVLNTFCWVFVLFVVPIPTDCRHY